MEIEHDPRGGVLIVTPPGQLPIIGFFGETGQQAAALAGRLGISPEQTFSTSLAALAQLCDSGPKELEAVRQFASVFRDVEDQGADFDDVMKGLAPNSLEQSTKSGLPDIEKLKRSLVSQPKRRRSRKDSPKLFPE